MQNDRFALTTYNDIQVYIDRYGVFFATVGDAEVNDIYLDRLKQKMDAQAKSQAQFLGAVELPCYVILTDEDEDTFSVEEMICTGLNRSSSALKWMSQHDGDIEMAVPAVPGIKELVQECAGALATLSRIRPQLKSIEVEGGRFGGRIDATDYPARLEGLRRRYADALKKAQEL